MDSSTRIFRMPQMYLQGPGILDRLGDVCRKIGSDVALVTDRGVAEVLGDRVVATIEATGGNCRLALLRGDVTEKAIHWLAADFASGNVNVVVGMGGGKALDAAKGVSAELGRPFISVPTSASNDGPTSACYAVYDERRVLVGVRQIPENPFAVLADSEIIANAPVQTLRAGIGDAITKKFEAEACAKGTGGNVFGTRPLLTAATVADLAYQTLRRDAVAAIEATAARHVSDALENVIEAVFLMGGLGFENGGLSVAHSMTRGLAQQQDARDIQHGLQVAWGLLAQIAVEKRPDAFLRDMIGFHRAVGLPVSLADLGLPVPAPRDVVTALANACFSAPHVKNFPKDTTPSTLKRSILRLEKLAQSFDSAPQAERNV